MPIPGYVPGNAVYIGSINSKNNHDGGLAGGPEFDFIWYHAGMPISGTDPIPFVNRYRINVSTSDVGSAKQIDLCIQPNWTTQEITNALIVIEKDGGKDKNGHVSLSYNYWGKILPVDVSYKYEKRDDFVFEKYLIVQIFLEIIIKQRKEHGNSIMEMNFGLIYQLNRIID